MSDQENFLTRWSRRKREIAGEKSPPEQPAARDAGQPAASGEDDGQAAATTSSAAHAPPAPEFDVTKLPSLESITASSDITAFLKPGVPAALKHAALRRAWAADPAIRDFVGLAENAWDFTDPNAMPGFGPLDPGYDIKSHVAKILGEVERAVEPDAELLTTPTSPALQSEKPTRLSDKSEMAVDLPAVNNDVQAIEPQMVMAPKKEAMLQRDADVATQHNDLNESSDGIKPRRHGSATPQ